MLRREVDVAVIGGGQAGLATAFYLRRAGLTPGEDFVVLEDGVPQTIEYFSPGGGESELSRIRPGLMLDTSASMERDLNMARSAAIKFLNLLPQSEDITLVDFDTEVRVMRYPQRDFPRLVDLYLDGRLKIDELVSRTYRLDEINDGFAALRSGSVARGVIVFD